MFSLIRKCVILSNYPKLNISGNDRIKNFLGGFTTITLCIVAISLFSYYLYYTLEKKDFLLSSNKVYDNKQFLTVNTSEVFYAIKVMDYAANDF